MSEMVERVAKAQAGKRWDTFDDEHRQAARDLARDGIKAIRELSDRDAYELIRTFNMKPDEAHMEAAREWHRRVIDAALAISNGERGAP